MRFAGRQGVVGIIGPRVERSSAAGGGLPARDRSQRRRRVGEALRHALSAILRDGECRDPALQDASITVTEVRLSADLRSASVFVMPLGGVNSSAAVAGLERCAGFLRARVARDVKLRFTPQLVFKLDPSFDEAARIGLLLARPEVERDLARERHDDRRNVG
jgi:ribosome-binding factor A